MSVCRDSNPNTAGKRRSSPATSGSPNPANQCWGSELKMSTGETQPGLMLEFKLNIFVGS